MPLNNQDNQADDWLRTIATIEKIRSTKGTHLHLSDHNLSSLPDSIADLVSVEVVVLTGNRLIDIPPVLSRLPNLRSLFIGHNRIAAIPRYLKEFKNLQSLFLHNNQIKTVPDFLADIINLRVLTLGQNRISGIPLPVTRLINLERFELAESGVKEIPPALGEFAKLKSLELAGNQIAEIPDFLTKLKHLQELHLYGNRIKRIPDHIAHLQNLQTLYLQGNQIMEIPNFIAKLTKLERLSLDHNHIAHIPDALSRLANLSDLTLSNNRLTSIPVSLTRLTNLKQLKLEHNPLPEELLAALKRGVGSFFRYLKSTSKQKVYPRTVKLVLLGEPKSGKTTLLEALKGNPRPCDPSRQETIGVNVDTLEKIHPGDGKSIFLATWDFAGQHIEHATHQFFLTENAIYIILWNARQGTESGKRDLWYWLELLRMRARNAKFLLVATHTEHTPPDLNLAEIQRSYPGFQGQFPVDLCTQTGLKSLEAKIVALASNSPSLRAEWPAEWLAVRNSIRNSRERHPYMSPNGLRTLFRKHGIRSAPVQKDLAGQLHELGEILYFQERYELSTLVILNPEWITELIALVLRSTEVRKQGGILSRTTLDKLWGKRALSPKIRSHLIHLMDWFDLTYSTGDRKDLGIVVEALPYSTVENLREIEFPDGDPQIEMIFKFPSLQRRLPPGIPTWGIARAHRYSKCAPWRDAAFFEDGNTRSTAIILASEATKEVRLRVAADYPPYFFGQLQAILLDTFKRYPGAEPERRLPCRCQPNCFYSYLFETVLKRRQDGKSYVTCDRSGEDVAIDSLLSGARRPDTPEGWRAVKAEMRRIHTEQLRVFRERMEKTCPSVFTLVPSKGFSQLSTWLEAATQEEELELALYCEHDSGWHATRHSLYRFRLDMKWLDTLKESWNKFAAITRNVGPLAKTIGKAAGVTWAEVVGLGIEKLPDSSRTASITFADALGRTPVPEFIDIETRYLLERLINHLDSHRPASEPKNGGLLPYIIDDGRLLWLCPDHIKLYRTRP